MNFKLWLEENVIPMGDCFRFATKLGVQMLPRGRKNIRESDVRVVHGIVHPKWTKREYPHAWVEANGRAYDWQMRKTVESISIEDFYELNRPKDIKKYTPAEAVGMAIKQGHQGPW